MIYGKNGQFQPQPQPQTTQQPTYQRGYFNFIKKFLFVTNNPR